MSFDIQRILESKRALRQRLAARPVVEKLRLLDAMRERAQAIRGGSPAAPRDSAIVREQPSPYGESEEKKTP